MSTTCLVCCEESEVWILPPCNHKDVCWKCCLKLIQGSIFSCPFCKDKPENKSQLLFVTTEEMQSKDFKSLMQKSPFRSYKNSLYFYSNQQVAQYIEAETSYHCVLCAQVHENLNLLKKHLSTDHRVQFCEVCLDNRRCIIGEQKLYADLDLQRHLKEGEMSSTGEIVLYHPLCEYCNRRFYDLDSFKIHLKMSSHLKCQICDINCPHFKYVYYRNFEDLDLHHRKTHFVCEVGDCIGRKLENVFASEVLLEDHKRRFHRKHRPDKQDRLDNNILLGFNKKQEEELIEFDKIGKDFSRQFTVFEIHDPVQKQQHTDQSIDLREFYPQLVRITHSARVEEIIHKLRQLHDQYGMKEREPEFSHIPLYKATAMSFLSRGECERLLRRSFPIRQAESLIEIFFTKRFQNHSPQDWIQALERKMRSFSNYCFYVIFPQLARNLKDQNKGKLLMDQFYSQKLHTLSVNRKFIFHQLHHYSELIQYTKRQVEQEVTKRLQNSEIDLEQYAHFLRDMNMTYYLHHQEKIYWVSKEKITHLYHMVEHCRTRDLLKMNWLLKVGLSVPAYDYLRKFYYLTKQDLPPRPFQMLSLQEIALLKAYLTLCMQSILDQNSFNQFKLSARSHYLTNIIDELPTPSKIPKRQVEELRVLEQRAQSLNQKIWVRRGKGIVIDQRDCPSLLQPIDLLKPSKIQTKLEPAEILMTRALVPRQWNEELAKIKKKLPLQTGKQQQEFPTLGQKSTNSKQEPRSKQKQQSQDFPVFNFHDKFVTHKLPTPSVSNQINNLIGFNNKSVNRSYWDQDRTRKKLTQDHNQPIKVPPPKIQPKPTFTPISKKKQEYEADLINNQEDPYLRQAIAESLKTAKIQQEIRANEQPQSPNIIIYKKQKIDVQQTLPKTKKSKKVKNDSQHQKSNDFSLNEKKKSPLQKITAGSQKKNQQPLLFERIQMEEKIVQKQSFRRDISSEKKNVVKVEQKSAQKFEKILSYNAPIFTDDDFQPLQQSHQSKESIITRIIKESQTQEQTIQTLTNKQKRKLKNQRANQDY